MFMRKTLLVLVLASLLNGCAALPIAQPEATETPATDATATEADGEEATPISASPSALIVWLPPRFDPNDGSLAASILQARIDEFVDQHPQVRVDVRVKAQEGTGGLLDSLQQAQAAAPLALPDVVLLPHTQLSAAVASDLLLPFASLGSESASADWYEFARDMASVQGQTYGLPFGADALVTAVHPTAVANYPESWSALLEARLPLGFAAADPQALFTLAELQGASGEQGIQDGQVSFSQETLLSVFEFFEGAAERNVFPFWLTQYQNQEQSWQAFTEGRVPMVASRISRVFDTRNTDIAGAPLPTHDGSATTLVEGWVWSVTTPDSAKTELAEELAAFLTAPEFLAQFSAAAGLLPARPSSLAAWSPDARQALASQLVENAVALPDEAQLTVWGTALSENVVALLKQELTAEEAMQAVLAAVANP